MQYKLKDFKKIANTFNKVKSHVTDGLVGIDFEYINNYQEVRYNVRYSALTFRSISAMYNFAKVQKIPLMKLTLSSDKYPDFCKQLFGASVDSQKCTIQPISKD